MLIKKFKRYFILSLLFPVVSSISVGFIPLIRINCYGGVRLSTYAIGGIFWFGVIFEQVFFWKANFLRKQIEKQLIKKKGFICSNNHVGIISFFQNNEAKICDGILFIFIVLTIIFYFIKIKNEQVIISCVAILFLSINFHCFFNGKNYKCLKMYLKNVKDKEKNENG